MKNTPNLKTHFIAAAMLGVVLLSGCATTAPKADFAQGMALTARVAARDEVKARVEAGSGVGILDIEKTRIAQRVEERISAKKIKNTGNDERKDYEAVITLTRYEKGSAFGRFMLAGVGQIHIDGLVRLFELPHRKKIGEFEIRKTFAWGGIYGAATSMEDIENTFADGIAATLTGQEEDAAKDKNVKTGAMEKNRRGI